MAGSMERDLIQGCSRRAEEEEGREAEKEQPEKEGLGMSCHSTALPPP